MANAKKCDICGAYFGICEKKTNKVADYSFMNTITISQRDNKGNRIDTFNPMDCCPKCMENILDILNIKKKNDNDEDDKTKYEELCTVNDKPNDELCTKCWDQIAIKYYDEKEKNNEQN